jgi:hypothetical protein
VNPEPTVTNANDQKLIELIGQSRQRILYMAPGITEAVANAVMSAWWRLRDRVTVILDVDPEVCRLGYGTIEGLKTVCEMAKKMGTSVCQQPGVRIGLLICDDVTLIYSPTPLLIEAEARHQERPNAIQLQSPPSELAVAVGLEKGDGDVPPIGAAEIQQLQLYQAEADLKNNPPAKFDLARKVKVFTSRFQFVELEMTGCYVSRKKVPIPSNLMGLANDRDLQARFHAHFNLVNSLKLEVKAGDRVLTEEVLRKTKDGIVKDFLIPLKGYGNVVLRGRKERLQTAVHELRNDVALFSEGIEKGLQAHMDENAAALVSALMPAVKQNPPNQYTKFLGDSISDDELRDLVWSDIKRAFGRAENLISDMTVSLIFKDVAYESLVDGNFLEVARKAMPRVESLHEEFEATRALQPEEAR